MALRNPWPVPDADQTPEEQSYDDIVADSFPASDPPPGVIRVGPRRPARTGAPPSGERQPPRA